MQVLAEKLLHDGIFGGTVFLSYVADFEGPPNIAQLEHLSPVLLKLKTLQPNLLLKFEDSCGRWIKLSALSRARWLHGKVFDAGPPLVWARALIF